MSRDGLKHPLRAVPHISYVPYIYIWEAFISSTKNKSSNKQRATKKDLSNQAFIIRQTS
ncbi:hypothetical protein LguiB_017228 [Lonicera macranthoides]